MKKLMIMLSIVMMSLTLVGCTESSVTVIPPVYQGITVNGTSPVDGDILITHYEGKQGIVLVNVSFTNTGNVAIKSININGYTYNSSRFLEGSTNTLVQLEVNVGDVLQETIYSIDRFSYVNGENTVNINITGNNEFSIYVYKDFPEITRESYTPGKTTITIGFVITDVDDIIDTNTLRAVIYDGDVAVDTVQISDKDNATVIFTGLNTDKHYDVKVYGTFDRDDQNDVVVDYVFSSDTYVTVANGIPSAIIEQVVVDANKVTFDVDILDIDEVIVEGGLKVIINKGEEFETETYIMDDVQGVVFDDLLNDTDYTIKIIAEYDLLDNPLSYSGEELATYSFKTLPREIPLPVISGLTLEENSIDFNLSIDNEDDIIDLDSMYVNLYIKGNTVDDDGVRIDEFIGKAFIIKDHVSFQISNVYSGTVFILEVKADYDLNNEAGLQEDKVIDTQEIGTQTNVAPELTGFSIFVTQGYVSVGLDISDPNDTIIRSLVAKLYIIDEETEVVTVLKTASFDISDKTIIFNYATQKEVSYYIEVFADYNLRDDAGNQDGVSLGYQVSVTKEAKIPVAELSDLDFSDSTIEFNLDLIDADATIIVGTTFARIYDADEEYFVDDFVEEIALLDLDDPVRFLNLLSDHTYIITIVTKYDLDDGTEVALIKESTLATFEHTTLANSIPTITLSEESVTPTTVVVDSTIVDLSTVIDMDSLRARIYHVSDMENAVASLTLDELFEDDIEFSSLYSNNQYYVGIYVNYDLRDGNGEIENVQLQLLPIRTNEKIVPEVEFGVITTTNTELSLDIKVVDPDGIATGDLQAVLFDSNGETLFVQNLATNINAPITFTGLLSNEEYTVYVFADYDLHTSASSALTHQVLDFSERVVTDPLAEININLQNIDSTLDSIDFDVEFIDDDSVIKSDLKVTLYEVTDGAIDLNAPLATLTLTTVLQEGLSFTGLMSDTDYRLVFSATYNFNDQTDLVTDGEIGYYNIRTKIKTPPTASVNIDYVTENELKFELNLFDEYNVLIAGSLYAELIVDGNTRTTKNVTTGLATFDLTGLLADQEFEIIVTATYDLGDGANQITAPIGSVTGSTGAYSVPTGGVTSIEVHQNSLDIEVLISDPDETITTGLIVELRDGLGVLLETELLTRGLNSVSFPRTLNEFEAYTILIYTKYDLRDGDGEVTESYILQEFVKYVDGKLVPEAEVKNVTSTVDSITVTVDVFDTDLVITAPTTFVDLLLNGVVVQTSAAITGLDNDVTFNGLVSNSNYTYIVRTNYDLDGNAANGIISNETISSTSDNTVATIAKDVLTGDIIIENRTIDSILIDITIIDTDNVREANSMFLYVYEVGNLTVPVHTLNLTQLTYDNYNITGLNSDSDYKFVLQVNYDLDEDVAPMIETDYKLFENTTSTISRTEISATIDSATVTGTDLEVVVTITDDDSTLTGNLKVVLYNSLGVIAQEYTQVDGLAVSALPQTINFTGLLNDETYYIYIVANYDMHDTVNTFVAEELTDATQVETDALEPVTGTIINIIPFLTTIDFDAIVVNVDGVPTNDLKAYLYLSSDLSVSIDEFAVATGTTHVTFSGLNTDTSYTIKLMTDYNLNVAAGEFTDQLLVEEVTTTLLKLPPTVTGNNLQITKSEVSFELTINDPFDVYQDNSLLIELWVDGVAITSKTLTTDVVTFDISSLLAGQDFEIKVTGTYDLGTGAVTEKIGSIAGTTITNVIPSGQIDSVTVNQNTVDIVVTITDIDNTATTNLSAVLKNEAGGIVQTIPLVQGVNNTFFTATLNEQELYTIYIVTDYNLRDGEVEETGYILQEVIKYVDNKLAPEASIDNETFDKTSISIEVDVFDTDLVINGATVARLYLDGVFVKEITGITGLDYAVTFNLLQSNTEYYIEITTAYNNGSGIGNVVNYLIASTTITTEEKIEAEFDVQVDTVTSDSIVYDIIITDNDGVTGTMNAVLYDNITEIGRIAVFDNNNINVTFLGLTGATDYTLVIEYVNNVNDGLGDVDTEFESRTTTTDDIAIPVATVTVTPTNNTLVVDYEIADPDGAEVLSELILYLDGVEQLPRITITGTGTHTFTGLIHNSDYKVEVESTYNLNDLNGDTTSILFTSDTDTTSLIAITNEVTGTKDSVLDVEILDPDDLIKSAFVTARLIRDGVVINTYVVVEDIPTTINMIGLLSDNTYTLELIADVDYGAGTLVAEVIYSHEFTTTALTATTASIQSGPDWTFTGVAGSQTLSFTVDVSADTDEVAVDTSYKVDIYEDGVFKETVDLTTPEGSTVTVTGLDTDYDNENSAYTVVVYADMDMNDSPLHVAVTTNLAATTFVNINE